MEQTQTILAIQPWTDVFLPLVRRANNRTDFTLSTSVL
jgi:hypothetical protein